MNFPQAHQWRSRFIHPQFIHPRFILALIYSILLIATAGCVLLDSSLNTAANPSAPSPIQTTEQSIDANAARVTAYRALLSTTFKQPPNIDDIWHCFSVGNKNCVENPETAEKFEALILDSVTADQLHHAQNLFERYPLHQFEPSEMMVRTVDDKQGLIPAAVSTQNEVVLIYNFAGQTIQLAINDPSLIKRAEWFNPRSGEFSGIDDESIRANAFTPPQSNSSQNADYLLLIHISLSATGKNAPIPQGGP